jgi:hypothetical protein
MTTDHATVAEEEQIIYWLPREVARLCELVGTHDSVAAGR